MTTGGEKESGVVASPDLRAPDQRASDQRASDLRARDILAELVERAVLGARLVQRVGARAFEVPAFAKGHRIFARCGVPDPWDPMAPQVDVALGDVGLGGRKLPAGGDPNRRQPAPHAAPPTGPAAAAAAAAAAAGRAGFPPGFRPPDVPSTPKVGKPAPKIGDMRPDDTARLKHELEEKGRRKVSERASDATRVRQPVKNLPVRPGFGEGEAGPTARAAPPAGATGAAASGAATGTAATLAARRSPPGPPPGSPAGSPSGSGARPAPPLDRGSAPRPTSPRPPGPAVAPRVSMASSRSSAPSGPVEIPMDRPEPSPPLATVDWDGPSVTTLPEPEGIVARPAPAPPRAPPRPGGGNLDDLFGMGGGDQGRLRFGEPTEEPRPRRPRLTDPSQVPGSLDRRPPPPKPPVVIATPQGSPASGPAAGSPDGLPEDE